MKPVVLILLAGAMQAASLHGIVRDPQGKPLPGVTIQIRTDATQSSQTAKSGDNGAYRFATLVAGTYFVQVNSHPQIVILHSKDDKELDLVRQGASDTISFSDEPNFVVAGVTDNTYMGSHGSDVKQRSVENLSKATNELKTDVSVQSETSLKAAIEREPSNARLHHALAEAGERSGRSLDAAHEYQRAAELDGSEQNLFDWGAELLTHGAPEAAQEVFQKGTSTRMLLGAAAARYSRGDYTEAAKLFFRAADINPDDSIPYTVLAQAQAPEITNTSGYRERMERFAKLQPGNAVAQYLFGLSVLNGNEIAAEAAFRRAVQLDPKLGDAYLQLGTIEAQRDDDNAAITLYRQALVVEPDLEQAHYRLAAAYRKIGNHDAGQRESEIFRQLAASAASKRESERSQLQRFVVTLKAPVH